MCCEPGLSAIGLLLTTCLLRAVNRRLYAAKSLTAKIQNERAFCKKKREFLPTILRSENFALKVVKPFVLGRFSKGRKRSEMGRKKVGCWMLVVWCWWSQGRAGGQNY